MSKAVTTRPVASASTCRTRFERAAPPGNNNSVSHNAFGPLRFDNLPHTIAKPAKPGEIKCRQTVHACIKVQPRNNRTRIRIGERCTITEEFRHDMNVANDHGRFFRTTSSFNFGSEAVCQPLALIRRCLFGVPPRRDACESDDQ